MHLTTLRQSDALSTASSPDACMTVMLSMAGLHKLDPPCTCPKHATQCHPDASAQAGRLSIHEQNLWWNCAPLAAGPCKLDMVLYSEAVGSATMAAFYPVNALRNRALAQAKTEVRLSLDLASWQHDVLPLMSLHDDMQHADVLLGD